MPHLIQVRRKAQLTLPQPVRQALNIEEGDFLDVRVQNDQIVMRVKKLVDKGQAWFWSRRWQDGEREAEEDVKQGKVWDFPSAKEAVSFLHDYSRKSEKTKGKS